MAKHGRLTSSSLWIDGTRLRLSFGLQNPKINAVCNFKLYKVNRATKARLIITRCESKEDCSHPCGAYIYIYGLSESTTYTVVAEAQFYSAPTEFDLICNLFV